MSDDNITEFDKYMDDITKREAKQKRELELEETYAQKLLKRRENTLHQIVYKGNK